MKTVTSVFPSVTGPAYAPFLTGMHPGSVGLPGLRWFDRSRSVRALAHARSYVGPEMTLMDSDLDAHVPTMFELARPSLGALSVIRRGLEDRSRIGASTSFALRAGVTHFRGDVDGWLSIDRDIGDEVVSRIASDAPRFVFAAFTGIDKSSHALGASSRGVVQAMKIVDDVVARIRADAERSGRWNDMHVWIVSDHGHSEVVQHDDVVRAIRGMGHRVLAHPWTLTRGADVALMVSGNAMAHVYVGLDDRSRRFWGALAREWDSLASDLLARESVDIMLLPTSERSCRVLSRVHGEATRRVGRRQLLVSSAIRRSARHRRAREHRRERSVRCYDCDRLP